VSEGTALTGTDVLPAPATPNRLVAAPAIVKGVEVRLATRDDIEPICHLLAATFKRSPSVPFWRGMLEYPYLAASEKPHYGAVLTVEGRVRGYNGVIFADRLVDGRIERFGNRFGWCVDPEYRRYSIAVVRRLISDGVTWTNLTSRPDLVPLFLKLGYQQLDTRKYVCYAGATMFFRGGRERRVRVLQHQDVSEARLGTEAYRIYVDHIGRTVQRIVFAAGEAACLVVTKRAWFPAQRSGKGLAGTELYYASDRDFLRRFFDYIRLRLFMRDKTAALLADERLLGFAPKGARAVPATGLFKSDTLAADRVDALYSELTLLP
jgi:hypothetical protein